MSAKLQRRLSRGRKLVPEAVQLCRDLAEAVREGQPEPVLLVLVAALRDTVMGLEDAVGVETPQALFD